jgi:hypothetical protein
MLLQLATLLSIAAASNCVNDGGNWYCDQTQQITFSGLGGVSGSYDRVTNMNPDACTCSKAPQAYSGPLSPLDEDLSLHFRGPIAIKQFAAYTLQNTPAKKKRGPRTFGERFAALFRREQVVYTLIAPISTRYASATAAPVTPTLAAPVATTTLDAPTSTPPPVSSGSSWQRSSYYNAGSGTLQNAVFMNNMGGVNGSGTWSPCFGNSLAYASSSGSWSALNPEVLADVTLPSNTEVIIFSGETCTQATCGYVAPGVPAYRGFAGANKVFLFEFSMPFDGDRGFNGDMPAIWALNGQIPRSQQYGGCSCWQTGCGELDLWETLSAGSDKMIATFHSKLGQGGSTPNWFKRPSSGTIKTAAIFLGGSKTIKLIQLPDSTSFDGQLPQALIDSWDLPGATSVTLVA